MGAKIGELYIDVAAKNVGQTEQGIGKVDGAAQKAANSFQKFAQSTLGITLTLGGFVLAIRKGISDSIRYAEEISRMSDALDISADSIQKFMYIASQTHTEINSIGQSMKILSRNIYEAATGNKELVVLFDKFNISIIDTNGNLRNIEDVFYDVISVLGTCTTNTERDALAMKLLGKSAGDMGGLIREGGKNLKEMGQHAENSGKILSGSTLKVLNNFDDSIKELGIDFKIFTVNYLLPLIKTLTDLAEPLKIALEYWNKLFQKPEIEEMEFASKENIKYMQEQIDFMKNQYLPGLVKGYENLTDEQRKYANERIAFYEKETKKAQQQINATRGEYGQAIKIQQILTIGFRNEGEQISIRNEIFREYLRLLDEGKFDLQLITTEEQKFVDIMNSQISLVRDFATPVFGSFWDTLIVGENTWQEFGQTVIRVIKDMIVQMLAMASVATLLNILFPDWAQVMGGFGGVMKFLGGFQHPSNDMWANREGSDFGRLFFKGFGERMPQFAGSIQNRTESIILKIYAEPGIIVDKFSKMSLAQKIKLHKQTTKYVENHIA